MYFVSFSDPIDGDSQRVEAQFKQPVSSLQVSQSSRGCNHCCSSRSRASSLCSRSIQTKVRNPIHPSEPLNSILDPFHRFLVLVATALCNRLNKIPDGIQ